MKNRIGCSGFNYEEWKGDFYPEDLPEKKWLEYYADHFDTVEINNTFYHLPMEKTIDNWHERTPGHFMFTLKGSRFITHQKKLNDVGEAVKNFYELASRLKGKLGCILWQLPGNQHKDVPKLKSFSKALSSEFRNAIEFRHNSWFDQEVYDVLRKNEVAFCMISAPGDLKEDTVKTARFAYVRFHGKNDWYKYHYSEEELKKWSEKLREMKARQIYAYFNNDYNANAPDNAGKLAELMQ